MNLRALRDRTATWFEGLGIPTPKLDAEVLIAHALGITRIAFITDGDRPLTDEELDSCRELVRRRGKREPVAYILGSREFWSRDFAVDSRVLIPRPETEHLVDLALQWLKDGARRGEVVTELDPVVVPEHVEEAPAGEETDAEEEGEEPAADEVVEEAEAPAPPPEPLPDLGVVLDYGTGSGAIAVTLAAELPGLRVLAVDISRDALDVARENAATHEVAERVGFVHSDGLSRVPARFRGAVRAIVANPPYVPRSDRPDLMPEVRDFEPEQALFPADDPLFHYRVLTADAPEWLAEGGFLAVELGAGQADAVRALFEDNGWRDVTVRRDLAGIPRVVAGWRP